LCNFFVLRYIQAQQEETAELSLKLSLHLHNIP